MLKNALNLIIKKKKNSSKKQISYIKIDCSNENTDIVVSFDF